MKSSHTHKYQNRTTTTRMSQEPTALLLIDMQQDFVRTESPVRVAGAAATVPAVTELLKHCRTAGIPVYHIIRSYNPDGPPGTLCETTLHRPGNTRSRNHPRTHTRTRRTHPHQTPLQCILPNRPRPNPPGTRNRSPPHRRNPVPKLHPCNRHRRTLPRLPDNPPHRLLQCPDTRNRQRKHHRPPKPRSTLHHI